jgi:DNA-binding MarR family transcriptional regulator
METFCKIRDIYRSIVEFESTFQRHYGLACSNASKVIVSAEKKGLTQRTLGDNDKRQMYFTLTEKGEGLLITIRERDLVIPELLKTILSQNDVI